MYFAIAAIGLNVQFGYTGLLNFGQAAFLACGAYGIGHDDVLLRHLDVVGARVRARLRGRSSASCMGIPTLRLRADYLAIVTIAIAEVVRLLVRSQTFRNVFGAPTASPTSPAATATSARSTRRWATASDRSRTTA